MNAKSAKIELLKHADENRVAVLKNFFKTGKGQYGEGDIFVGVNVPNIRSTAKIFCELQMPEIEKLLKSKIHEVRLLALAILTYKYEKADTTLKKEIFNFYLLHTEYINNWDLVDLSAPKIVGDYLLHNTKGKNILINLAKSKNMWERRVAIISTFAYIYDKQSEITFKISEMLLEDKEDLIHKAVGWMLREVGKRVSKNDEILFLDKHYTTMPRTMLRYAIEHFSAEERAHYMTK